jgi:hypothetical protein
MKLKVRKTFKKKVYRTTHQADAEGAVEEDEYEDPEGEDEEDDVQEVTDEEDEDDENDVNHQDDDEDEDVEDVDDEDDDVSVRTEEVEENFITMKEAFAAGWKAKQKVNAKRKARGFTDGKGIRSQTTTKKKSFRKKTSTIRVDPQKLRKSGDRGKGSGKGKGSGSSGGIDKRKENSHCNDCKGKGHWAGDDKCPMVMAGKRPPHAKKGTHHTCMVEQVTTTKPVWLNFMVQNVPIPDPDGSEANNQVARPADDLTWNKCIDFIGHKCLLEQ